MASSKPPHEPEDALERFYQKYLEPIQDELGLTDVRREGSDFGGFYEARGSVLRVRLVSDRSLVSFEVSPLASPGRWDAELLAELLEPERRPAKGIRRLSLEQQAQLLRDHWAALQQLFSAPTLLFTNQMLTSLGQRRAAKMFGDI